MSTVLEQRATLPHRDKPGRASDDQAWRILPGPRAHHNEGQNGDVIIPFFFFLFFCYATVPKSAKVGKVLTILCSTLITAFSRSLPTSPTPPPLPYYSAAALR